VLVQQHTTPETRLHTLWRGPMKVIKSIKGQHTLLDLTNLKVSRSRLVSTGAANKIEIAAADNYLSLRDH
jgi:hypothetical protein